MLRTGSDCAERNTIKSGPNKSYRLKLRVSLFGLMEHEIVYQIWMNAMQHDIIREKHVFSTNEHDYDSNIAKELDSTFKLYVRSKSSLIHIERHTNVHKKHFRSI